VPAGDVLLHAGDFSQTGTPKEVASFCAWLRAQPHARKIVIGGNHDLSLHGGSYARTGEVWGHAGLGPPEQLSAEAVAMLKGVPGVEYLCDSGTCVRGVSVWGSPWQPEFGEWAFNLPRGAPCRAKWELVPAGTDVVMTHGPPLGHGDLCKSGLRAGCVDLLDELQARVRPAFHVFGHIHEGYGATTDGRTTFLNGSTCNFDYRPDNLALVFDMPAKE
jgi:predicted phosphodiesterase